MPHWGSLHAALFVAIVTSGFGTFATSRASGGAACCVDVRTDLCEAGGSQRFFFASVGAMTRREWSGRSLRHPHITFLRLRGGMWYSGEEDSDDYDYYDDEQGSEEEEEGRSEQGTLGQQASAAESKPGVLEGNVWTVGGEVWKGDGIVVPDENGSVALPLGTWNAGRFRDIIEPRYTLTNRSNGPLPSDCHGPTILRDYYGLGKYTILSDEEPHDPAYQDKIRSLLKVPINELPEPFHWLTGGGEPGSNKRLTLAERFSEWQGPAPDTWQARCDSTKGAVMAYSCSKDTNLTHDNLDEDLGGKEQGAYFRFVTDHRFEKGECRPERDGTFPAGPYPIPENIICNSASSDVPFYGQIPPSSAVRQKLVGHDRFVFQAVNEAEFMDELVVAGAHEWGRATELYPANFIDVDKPDYPLFLRGSNPCPVEWSDTPPLAHIPSHSLLKPWGVDPREMEYEIPPEMGTIEMGTVETWDAEHAEDEEVETWLRHEPQSVLSGQWRLSNSTYGYFSHLQMIYHTVHRQPVIQVYSGPWVIDSCDIRCSAGICLQILFEGVVDVRQSSVGGTGREYCIEKCSPGVALIACDVDGNGNLTMTKSVIEDAGWHGGAGFLFAQEATGLITDCRIQRCRTAIYMVSFCDVTLRGCLLKHNMHGAFVSFCYWMPHDMLEGYDDMVREAVWGDAGHESIHPGHGLSEQQLREQGSGGSLRIFGCTVIGTAWPNENRPLVYLHDGDPALLD